jgi:hypothetical protein
MQMDRGERGSVVALTLRRSAQGNDVTLVFLMIRTALTTGVTHLTGAR